MTREKIGNGLTALVLCIGAVLFIIAGKEASDSAAAAVRLCLSVIIPSLFAFTVISKLLVSTGAYGILGKPFGAFSRYILRIPADRTALFLISQAAGYPIGAALISELYRQGRISKREAEDLLCCCIAPGPAYIMAVSRAAAPDKPGLWKAVFISVFGANLLIALAGALFRSVPEKKGTSIPLKPLTSKEFVNMVRSGSESMMMICAAIVFMAALMGAAERFGVLSAAAKFFGAVTGRTVSELMPFVRSFFEISNLTYARGAAADVLPAAAALLSFGGLCVHMQIAAVSGDISVLPAFLARIPASAAAFFICKCLIPHDVMINAVAVQAPVTRTPQIISQDPPILSVFLFIMTILIISQKSIVKTEKI